MVAKAAAKLLETGLGSLTRRGMRSYGTKTKIRSNQVKIGGTEGGLYYDKDLPFLKTVHTKTKDGRNQTKYRLRGQGKRPSDMLDVQSWDPIKKKKVKESVRRDDPRLSFYTTKAGNEVPTLLEFGRMTKGEKIAKPLAEKIYNNPQKYGALDDKGNLSIHKVKELINAKFVDEGLNPYQSVAAVNRILKDIRGKIKFAIKGTPKETEIVNFLKKDDLYKTAITPDVAKHFPDVPTYIIDRIRQANKLSRTNIGDSGKSSKVSLARRKLERMIANKYGNLTKEQVEAVAEHGRTFFQSKRHTPVQPRYGMKYPDEDIQTAFNFLDDTFLKYMPPEINEYAFERALNNLRRQLTGKKYTVGHSRRSPEDWWWFGGDEVAATNPQLSGLNLRQKKLDDKFQSAIRRNDIATAEEAMTEMMQKGMRSSMVDDYGELIFYGAPPKKGKMAEGGIVNGYAGGGIIKKLLGDSLGMMSRRKFMKGMGATAASAALPRSAMKLAAPLAKKAGMEFAPPWVNGMLSALKDVPTTTKTLFRMGNNSQVQKIGSNKIKLFGGKTGTESHFKVKPSDETMADDMFPSEMKDLETWDDIVLMEEPGQTTISWKNKMYDHGNDQHIVIDKINKETRFVDDNWHMEAGGEDIAKDDWIEYAMTTDKKALAKEMGLAKGDEIGEKLVDEWSVSGMENDYADMFRSYVDSFSPSGNVFGTVKKMRDMLNKPMSKEMKKNVDKMQKKLDTHQENKMLDWEEQFRGGHGMHGYYRGGTSMRDYPRARKMDLDKLVDSVGMAETSPAYMKANNLGERHLYKSPSDNRGTYGTGRATAMDPGVGYEQYGATRWTDFDKTWRNPTKQRAFTKNYLKGMIGYYNANPNEMIYGSDPYYEALLRYGPIKTEDNPDPRATGEYFNRVMKFYDPNWSPTTFKKGGSVKAKKFSVEDAVAMIKASPQKFMGGGLVKLLAPKVTGKVSRYKPKITGKGPDLSRVRTDLYEAPPGPYSITNDRGALELDRTFETLDEAQAALKELAGLRLSDASTFKIFGKRPPKTKAGVSEGAPEVDLGMVGKKLPPEKPGAMFWGSREKIIHAPSEAMTGKQWLQYLQLGKHGILNPKGFPIVRHMELNDTGLAPHLSKMGNKTVSKEQLVKDFDTKLAPELDVTVLGSTTGGGGKFYNKMSKMDLQPYREGPVKNVLKTVKDQGYPLKEALANNNTDEIMRIIKEIEDSTFNNFGVANSIMEGFPQKFPFELKKVLQEIAQLSGARTAGFKKYAKEVQYSGQQTLGGGQNYREFLFKYKHPAGSLRETEPMTRYSKLGADHFSSLSDKDQMGGFVHMRTSDRTDEFGRRILHIEEIQSDMHQKVNSAMRSVKRMKMEGKPPVPGSVKQSKYAPRGDMIVETVDKANEQHLALLASKIEDLAAMPQTKATQVRLVRLNKERAKVRKMIQDKKAKMAKGDHSGVAQGPYSKTEDYNEFVIKYAEKVAQEGGYDGVTISSSAIKNRSLSPGNTDYGGNVVAYGPMAEGAMKKVAKKSGAKYLKTSIIDDKGRGWEVPLIWLDDQSKFNVARGLPAYKRGGIAVNG